MTTRAGGAGDDGRPPVQYAGLLTEVMTNTLDADYEQVAQSPRAAARRPAGPIPVIAVFTVFGLMVGVSALQTEQDRPREAAERAELVDQIHSRQDRLDDLHAEQAALEDSVSRLQGTLADDVNDDQQLSGELTRLGIDAGTLTVTGPGVVVTVDDAHDGGGLGGVILDTDLQQLVNALWEAGAESIAVDGHRITTLNAIRFAGEAITVGYRSLSPPYVIEATGDPDTLPARLLQTEGGQTWLGLRTNFGITFEVAPKDSVVVPGDPRDHVLYATPEEGG